MSISFEQVLQNINNFISLKKEDRETYATHFNCICREIITRLSADPVFKKIYNGQSLAGSYADNLKISKPNEYDLVLHMKLIELRKIKISKNEKNGYVNINVADVLEKIKTEKQNKDIYDFLKAVSDSKGYLIQNKITIWLEQLMQKIKLEFQQNGIATYKLAFSRNGPALTIDVNIQDKHFAIDFVPAFVFDNSTWTAERKCPPHAQNTNWIAVAKPIPSKTGLNIAFRTSYVDTERELIYKKNNLKNTLKMLKKIRDNHNLSNLKSYYIKTVFLWENEKKGPEFWNNPAGEVLMHMFQELVKCVTEQNLPFFWDKKENMLLNLPKENQRIAIRNDLTSIYKKLKMAKENNEVEKICDIFLNKDEKIELKKASSFVFVPNTTNNQVQNIRNQLSVLDLNFNNPTFKAKATTKAKQTLNNIRGKLNSDDPLHAMNQISLIVKQYETEMQLEQTNTSCCLQ